jgi:hypothetical protein
MHSMPVTPRKPTQRPFHTALAAPAGPIQVAMSNVQLSFSTDGPVEMSVAEASTMRSAIVPSCV